MRRHNGRPLPSWSYAFAVTVVILTVLVGWLIGALATPSGESFDWSTSAVAATAFATIALAGGTFVLAAGTLADAGASKRIAALTEQEMALRDRPTLATSDFALADGQPVCKFWIENVGLAPAMNLTVNMSGFDSTGEPVLTTGPISIDRVVRPGGAFEVTAAFFIRGRFEDWDTTELLTVSLDRRGGVNHSLRRWTRAGHNFIAASDFFTGWTPNEEMLKRLSGNTTSPVSLIERGTAVSKDD